MRATEMKVFLVAYPVSHSHTKSMKFCLILCLCFIASCSENRKTEVKKTVQDPEPQTTSKYKSTKDYISDVGIAHILEDKLEGYELKAAIVNTFQTSLFYYNEELQQLCIRPAERLLYDEDTMIFQINGKDTLAKTGYYLTEDKENGMIVRVDFEAMTDGKHDDLNLTGPTLAYGFKFKQTDSLHYFIRFYGNYVQQKVTVTYSPNTGWKSEASEISLNSEQVTANVFAFGKEKIVEQLRKIPIGDQECIIRTKAHPSNRFTMKFDLDSDYGDFNEYSVEIVIKEKALWVNNHKMSMPEISALIEEKFTDPRYRVDTRITFTPTSDDQTARELFRFISKYRLDADYSLGIK